MQSISPTFTTCFSVLQLNELVVGDTSGKLLVYKNDDTKPWVTRSCMGMVSEINSQRRSSDIGDAFILMCVKYVLCFCTS